MSFTSDAIRLQALYFLGQARNMLAERGSNPSDPHGALIRELLNGIYSESCDDFVDPDASDETHPATELWILGHQVALGAAMSINSWMMSSASTRLTAAILWLESGLSADVPGVGG